MDYLYTHADAKFMNDQLIQIDKEIQRLSDIRAYKIEYNEFIDK